MIQYVFDENSFQSFNKESIWSMIVSLSHKNRRKSSWIGNEFHIRSRRNWAEFCAEFEKRVSLWGDFNKLPPSWTEAVEHDREMLRTIGNNRTLMQFDYPRQSLIDRQERYERLVLVRGWF